MTTSPTSLPQQEYKRRLQQRRSDCDRHQAVDDRLSNWRGIVFLSIVAVLIAGGSVDGFPAELAVIPTIGFLILVVVHRRVAEQLKSERRAVAYYETALRRLKNDWAGIGPTGERYRNARHLYADDLDLFGVGSLFQLLCRAQTRLGEDRLSALLTNPATADEVRQRQSAIKELQPEVDLRESLALLSAEVHDDIDQTRLRDWAAQPPAPVSGAVRVAAVICSIVIFAVVAGWLFLGLRFAWVVIVATIMGLFLFRSARKIQQQAEAADAAASGLGILAQVLSVIESRQFNDPLLKSLRSGLETSGHPPSRHIARLQRLIHTLNNSLRNQFFAVFAFATAMPLHLIHAIECWRRDIGSHIPEWLDAVGRFEAFVSLSGFAYENSDFVFPEMVAADNGPCFSATELGHPLLPDDHCVRNDVHLDRSCSLMLVSGSNMSGKSTLLRTIGVNAVLAHAGTTVRAKQLRMSTLQIASSMRIHDSLQDGKSLFYAVLQRMKSIVDATGGKWPLLFLLDEILPGTNSHDRRIGAEGIIRLLVQRGHIGLVTTHDLSLTEIVTAFDGRAINCHFQDDLVDGKMTFDYHLRPGVVEKSNALELMRSMGLDV